MLNPTHHYECTTCGTQAAFTTRTERDIELRTEHTEHDTEHTEHDTEHWTDLLPR